MPDPLTQAFLLLWTIAWCMVGAWEAVDMERTGGFHGAAVLVCGPCVWAIALYRLLTRARRAIMRRAGVEGMSCCGGYHQRDSGLDT